MKIGMHSITEKIFSCRPNFNLRKFQLRTLSYFSTLASSLLNSIVDFLETGIDDFTASLYDWTMRDDEEELEENGEDYGDEDDETDADVHFDLRDTSDSSLENRDNDSRDDHVKRIQELRYKNCGCFYCNQIHNTYILHPNLYPSFDQIFCHEVLI